MSSSGRLIQPGEPGAKGDPGGWVTTSIAAGTDLNTITETGLYHQGDSTQATTALNYPLHLHGGTLEVMYYGNGNPTNVEQRYTPTFGGTNGLGGKVFYTRRSFNGSWAGAWNRYAYSRMDSTAGRAMYSWDEQNSREQLVYGDTGRRNIYADADWKAALEIPGSLDFNTAQLVSIRRTLYTVELFVAYDKAAAGTVTATTGFPVGFRPAQPFHVLGANSAMTLFRAYNGGGASTFSFNSTTAVPACSFQITYTTNDAWPTALPGTAVNAISNL